MQEKQTVSPCLNCQRVRDPKNCENKTCREWQAWFIDRWDTMRKLILQAPQGEGIRGATISVGGREYHHPDRVRQFLKVNPCLRCPRAVGLCPSPCNTKKAWLEAKESANELESGSQR